MLVCETYSEFIFNAVQSSNRTRDTSSIEVANL